MRLERRQIVVAAELLEDCQDSLAVPFREIDDQAISLGRSVDETLVALSGLISNELADRNHGCLPLCAEPVGFNSITTDLAISQLASAPPRDCSKPLCSSGISA